MVPHAGKRRLKEKGPVTDIPTGLFTDNLFLFWLFEVCGDGHCEVLRRFFLLETSFHIRQPVNLFTSKGESQSEIQIEIERLVFINGI